MTFFNIFSNKKEKPISTNLILVDYREKNSLVVPYLQDFSLQLKFENLPIGDYIINNIAIERKTISDFKSSVIDKRIFEQIKNLQQCPQNLLILEGILEEDIYNLRINENAFRGFLLSILLKQKIPLLFTYDAKDTAKYLKVLAMKNKENNSLSLRPTKIIFSEEEKKQYILEGFVGIGPVTAKKLLSHFGSLYSIFSASEEELKKVIGNKSKDFYSLLHSQN